MSKALPAAVVVPCAHGVSFGDASRVWVRVAALSFGGPAGQIAVMHRILVEEKRWIGESRFLHALNYTMLLPGPEAQQLATYIGWLLHGTRGGLVAGGLFVLPGFLSILALSVLYARFGDLGFVAALFFGLKAAVVAIVVEALVRISGRSLRNGILVAFAAAAFVAIFFLQVPFPLIILGAALAGWLGGHIWADAFSPPETDAAATERAGTEAGVQEAIADSALIRLRPSLRWSLRVASVWLAVWLVPVALLMAMAPGSVFVDVAVFFSKAAVVTFGGAYSVLAYVAQQAVDTFGWLAPGEMLDGLGMAETTPGPLIQVVQFVGFMGAYRQAPQLDPLLAGLIGSVVTTWVTFAPCFLFVFVGAPWIEHLRGNRDLGAALSGITAAVVGVILNLSVWFALHVLFGDVAEVRAGVLRLLIPVWETMDWAAAAITALSFFALFRLELGMVRTLAVAAGAGMIYQLLLRGS